MDHSDTGIRAVIKSLNDVVAPAIDPGDPLAAEQLKLVTHYLEFLRSRLDYLHDRERFDVGHHLGIGRRILAEGAPEDDGAVACLAAALDAAVVRLDDPATTTRMLKADAAELAARIAAVVDRAPAFAPDLRRRIELCVVDAMPERVAFERAWYVPLGLDPRPDTAPGLDHVCATPAAD